MRSREGTIDSTVFLVFLVGYAATVTMLYLRGKRVRGFVRARQDTYPMRTIIRYAERAMREP